MNPIRHSYFYFERVYTGNADQLLTYGALLLLGILALWVCKIMNKGE